MDETTKRVAKGSGRKTHTLQRMSREIGHKIEQKTRNANNQERKGIHNGTRGLKWEFKSMKNDDTLLLQTWNQKFKSPMFEDQSEGKSDDRFEKRNG